MKKMEQQRLAGSSLTPAAMDQPAAMPAGSPAPMSRYVSDPSSAVRSNRYPIPTPELRTQRGR